MRLSETVRRLAALKIAPAVTAPPGTDRLSDIDAFGDNPGSLRARTYLPDNLPAHAPLVVVLHGCTQTAAAYDHGAGWSTLADSAGFALLFPEQRRTNNANLCFNWFEPGDTVRGGGEIASIVAMVAAMVARHRLDPARVFVTGLSAGGAMAATLLATCPDIFAGGAIIAGLPHGIASGVPQAFEAMKGRHPPTEAMLQARLRDASAHRGPWPVLSLWQGSADTTVAPVNLELLLQQWRGVHGNPGARVELLGRHRRRVWSDAQGRARIEAIEVAGMAHGTPLDTAGGVGAAGPYMLDVGVSSTRHIAAFWGIAPAVAARRAPPRARPANDTAPVGRPVAAIGKVIEDAMRAAGLVR